MNENIGAVVENLLRVRDDCNLNNHEKKAIEHACNILMACCDRLDEPVEFLTEHVETVRWKTKDIGQALLECGFMSTKENIKTVLTDEAKTIIKERSIDGGWDAIIAEVQKQKDNLEKI